MTAHSASSAARWWRHQAIRAEVKAALSPQFFCLDGHRHPSAEDRDRCGDDNSGAATGARLAER